MPNPKKRDTIKIRPREVTLANGTNATARISYKRGDAVWWLPADGARVPVHGREGSFWKRRLAEGAVEVVSETMAKPKKGGE